MKRIAIFLVVLSLPICVGAFGRRNHAAIAYIAEQHLSPSARKAVQTIFPGETLEKYASRADDDRLLHWVKLEKGEYVVVDGNPVLKGPDGKPFCYGSNFFTDENGDVWSTIPHGWYADVDGNRVAVAKGECIWAAEYYAKQLDNWKQVPDDKRRDALMMIVHMIGDMHCPSHVHYTDARDRNDLKYSVIYRGAPIRYHNIWDTNILVDRLLGGPVDCGYLCDPCLNESLPKPEAIRQMKEIQSGSLEDWAKDVSSRLDPVFAIAPDGTVDTQTLHQFEDLSREMVKRAGYRLAKYLNDLFK